MGSTRGSYSRCVKGMPRPGETDSYVRSWEVLAESRLMSPEAAMRDCLRQLGWEVEGREEARYGRQAERR